MVKYKKKQNFTKNLTTHKQSAFSPGEHFPKFLGREAETVRGSKRLRKN